MCSIASQQSFWHTYNTYACAQLLMATEPERLARIQRFRHLIDHVAVNRTDRLLLVLECCADNQNYLACLRTADVLGVQNVWVVLPQGNHKQQQQQQQPPCSSKVQAHHPGSTSPAADPGVDHSSSMTTSNPAAAPSQALDCKKKVRIARNCLKYLDVVHYPTSAACIAALQEGGWTIWATDLDQGSEALGGDPAAAAPLPPRLALVMGREAGGISAAMRAAAHRCVHLPMYGFTSSLNLAVATGLVLQQLFATYPQLRGNMEQAQQEQLKQRWRHTLCNEEPSTDSATDHANPAAQPG